jgi:hypothetical protein
LDRAIWRSDSYTDSDANTDPDVYTNSDPESDSLRDARPRR